MAEASHFDLSDYTGSEISIFGHHECHRCGVVLKNVKLLVAHLADEHDGDFRFRCKICNQGFNRTAKLRDHLRKHVGDETYKCDVCDKILASAHSLKSHKNTHEVTSKASTWQCKYCEVVKNSLQELRNHVASHDPFQCKTCSLMFSSVDDYRNHMPCNGNPNNLNDTPNENITHSIDDSDINSIEISNNIIDISVDDPWKNDQSEYVYECQICEKTFDGASFREHLETHGTNETIDIKVLSTLPRGSDEMGSTTTTLQPDVDPKALIMELIKNGHQQLDPKLGNMVVPAAENLPTQIPVVAAISDNADDNSSGTPIETLVVLQVDYNASNLPADINPEIDHNQVPNDAVETQEIAPAIAENTQMNAKYGFTIEDEKVAVSRKCRVCGEKLQNVQSLIEHLATEHGEFRFRCKVCSKGFSRPNEMRLHMVSHAPKVVDDEKVDETIRKSDVSFGETTETLETGALTFLPEDTAESLLSIDHELSNVKKLKQRVVTPTITDFKCPVCDKVLAKSDSLKQHMQTHETSEIQTGKKQFPCLFCEETFSLASSLRRHLKNHEREVLTKSNDLTSENVIVVPLSGIQSSEKNANKSKSDIKRPSGMIGKKVKKRVKQTLNRSKQKESEDGASPRARKSPSKVTRSSAVNFKDIPSDSNEMTLVKVNQSNEIVFTIRTRRQRKISQAESQISNPCASESKQNPSVSTSTESGSSTLHSVEEENDSNIAGNDELNVSDPLDDTISGEPLHPMSTSEDRETAEKDKSTGFTSTRMNKYCSKCDLVFLHAKAFRSHMQTHLNAYLQEKDLADTDDHLNRCPECNGRFRRKDERNQHILHEHLGIHTLKCKECHQTFNSRNTAHAHCRRGCILNVFTCKVCKLTMNGKQAYNEHMETHSSDYPFSCEICGRRFKKAYLAKYHMVVHNKSQADRTYKCNICDFVVTNSGELRKHLQDHTRRQPPCSVCGMVLSSVRALKLHEKTHNPSDNLQCGTCNKKFTSKAKLRYHMSEHEGIAYFQCFTCKSSFFSPTELKTHSDICNKEEQQEPTCMCSKCQKTFSSVNSLRDHVKSHKTGRDHLCSICGRAYTLSRYLNKHMRTTHHPEKAKKVVEEALLGIEVIDHKQTPFRCAYCKKLYTRKSTLKEHLKTHADRTGYNCSVCGKEFYSEAVLRRHTRRHSLIRSHRCPTCDKAFLNKGHLLMHMRIHSDERPFKCNICDFSFKQPSAMNRHMALHTNTKKFQCTICQGLFSAKVHLKNHLLIHLRAKPHSCNTCGRAFRLKAALKCHSLIHRPPGNFPCNVCHKVFRRQHLLNNHRKRHKSLVCHLCDNVFTDPRSLRVHIKGHEGSILYTCTVCGKQFYREDMLRFHMNSHVSLKPFQCTKCPKGFFNQRDLDYHAMTHADPKYSCKVCGNMFRYKNGVKKHMLTMHSGEDKNTEKTTVEVGVEEEEVIAQTAAHLLECLNQNIDISQNETSTESPQPPVDGDIQVAAAEVVAEENMIIVESDNIRYTCKGTLEDILNSQSVDLQVIHAEPINDASIPGEDAPIIHHQEILPAEQNLASLAPTVVEVSQVQEYDEIPPPTTTQVEGIEGPVASTVLTDENGVQVLRMEELQVGEMGENAQIQICDMGESQEGNNVTYVVIDAADADADEDTDQADVHQVLSDSEVIATDPTTAPATSEASPDPGLIAVAVVETGEGIDMADQAENEQPAPQTHLAFTEGMTKEEKVRALHTCHVCNKYFPRRCKLKSHLLSHSTERPFACSQCEMSYKSRGTLKKHMEAVHDKIKNFACETCGKAFHERGHLNIHLRTHTNEKPHACDKCGKCFRDLGGFRRHQMVHMDLRPFVCSFCGKGFREMAHLTVHIRSHTGERPFKCSYCDRAFACASTRKQHERLHTGIRPYKCSFCDKSFIAHNRRQEHINTVHLKLESSRKKRDKPYVCLVCTKAYTNEQYLNAHLQKHGTINITMV